MLKVEGLGILVWSYNSCRYCCLFFDRRVLGLALLEMLIIAEAIGWSLVTIRHQGAMVGYVFYRRRLRKRRSTFRIQLVRWSSLIGLV